MTEREFFNRLQQGLQHLPPGELAEVLSFYREAIADRMEDGFSEEEAVRDLGDLESIIGHYPKRDRKTPAKSWQAPSGFKLVGCLSVIIAGPIVLGVLIMIGCILFSVAVTASMAILLMLPLILISAVGALIGCLFHRRGGFRKEPAGVAVSKTFGQDFCAIDFCDINTELEITPSPDDQIHLDYQESDVKKYTVNAVDQVLKIKGESRRSVKPVGIFSLLLPAGYRGDLRINANNGSVTGSAPGRLGEVGVTLDNGKIKLTKVDTAGNLTAQLDNGKINLQTIDCAGDLYVRGANGKADLKDIQVTGSLEVTFANSKITVEQISAGETIRLQSNIGTISGTVAANAQTYHAPTSITTAGAWGTPPRQLEIKLKVGKVKLEFAEN